MALKPAGHLGDHNNEPTEDVEEEQSNRDRELGSPNKNLIEKRRFKPSSVAMGNVSSVDNGRAN